MAHTHRRTMAAILAAVLVLCCMLTACNKGDDNPTGNNSTPGKQEDTSYEGERDANGKRSGYGSWTYHNFRYEGQWENDMPNGEGILYEAFMVDENGTQISIIKANWVDGYAEGEVIFGLTVTEPGLNELTHLNNHPDFISECWRFEMKKGYPTKEETIYNDYGWEIKTSSYYPTACVPPFADVQTNSEIPAPAGTNPANRITGKPQDRVFGEYSGNYGGNYSGSFLINGGYVYCSGKDSQHYKISSDGSSAQKVDAQTFMGIPKQYRVGGRVYYLYEEYEGNVIAWNTVHRSIVSSVGDIFNEKTVLKNWGTDRHADIQFVDDEWIYYSTGKLATWGIEGNWLHRISLDGTRENFVSNFGNTQSMNYTNVNFVGDYIYYIDNAAGRSDGYNGIVREKTDGTGKAEIILSGAILELNSSGDYLYFVADGTPILGTWTSPFCNTGSTYIGKLKISDAVPGLSNDELFAKTEQYDLKRPLSLRDQFYIAYDWLYFLPDGSNDVIMIKTDFTEQKMLSDIVK